MAQTPGLSEGISRAASSGKLGCDLVLRWTEGGGGREVFEGGYGGEMECWKKGGVAKIPKEAVYCMCTVSNH